MDFNLIQKELIITHTFPNITDLQDSLQSLGMYSQIKTNIPKRITCHSLF